MLKVHARFKNCQRNILWSSKNQEILMKYLDVKQDLGYIWASFLISTKTWDHNYVQEIIKTNMDKYRSNIKSQQLNWKLWPPPKETKKSINNFFKSSTCEVWLLYTHEEKRKKIFNFLITHRITLQFCNLESSDQRSPLTCLGQLVGSL